MYNAFCCESCSVWDNRIFILHTLLALMCWPLYWAAPWIGGVLVSPYVTFLIFRPRQEYLLPLILQTWYGSQQRYIMLAACFLYCIVHYKQLQALGIHIVFTIYLLFLPFFIWYTYARINLFHSFVTGGIYEGLSYYLSLSPFFWASVAFRRINKRFFWWLMVVSLLIVMRNFFFASSDDDGLLTGSTIFSYSRFHSWGSVYLFVVCAWAFVTNQNVKMKAVSLFAALLFILGFLHIGHSLIPFHLAGSAALGVVIIVYAWLFRKYLMLLHPWMFIIAFTVAVFWAINQYERRMLSFENVRYDEINVRSIDDLILRIENKLYGDRAPIWTASMDAVRQQTHKSWFFVNPQSVSGELYRDDGLVVEVEMQAHNMFLEVLRLYGVFGGGGILISFFLLVGLKRIRLSAANLRSPCAPVAAAAIGHIVFGYFGGQYLMIPAFSFTLYSLIGVCYRNQFEYEKMKLYGEAVFS